MAETLELDPVRGAAASARAFVSEQAVLDPIRQAEAALLVTELVSAAVRTGTKPLGVTVDRGGARVLITVTTDADLEAALGDPLTSTMFDRFARSFGIGDETAWFEIRPPGAGAAMEAMPAEELLSLAADDSDARAEVIRRYGTIASNLARRYRGKGVSLDDLEQVAMFALLKALSRYQADRGAFEAFASATISGELKRQLRDKAWSLRVPRSLQELALEVNRETGRLSQRLGRSPTLAELAEVIGASEDDIIEAQAANGVYWTKSLDMPTGDDDSSSLADVIDDPTVDVEAAGAWGSVATALDQLPERERRIVYLRFFEDMTQSEIAEIVGVSQMHVSRLLSRSLDQLRELTGAD